VTVLNDGELAWRLASEITPRLEPTDRTTLYLKLGCGDNFDAIFYALGICCRDELQLSREILTQVGRWQDGYAGSGSETTLRHLVFRTETQCV
jgi:hypothetical protein